MSAAVEWLALGAAVWLLALASVIALWAGALRLVQRAQRRRRPAPAAGLTPAEQEIAALEALYAAPAAGAEGRPRRG